MKEMLLKAETDSCILESDIHRKNNNRRSKDFRKDLRWRAFQE